MKRTFLIAAWLGLLAVVPRFAAAQAVGDKVVVIQDNVVLKIGDEVVHETRRGSIWPVREERGDWIGVECPHCGKFGYVKRQHVVALGQAVPYWTRTIQASSRDSIAYTARGVVYHELHDFDNAIADYGQSIRIAPSHRAFHNRACAWQARSSYDKALADFDEAIQLDPKCAAAHDDRARLWATCPDARYRDGNKAVEEATKACELSEWRNTDYIDTLAAAYAEVGDFDEAVTWQTKILEAAPEASKESRLSRLALYRARKPYRDIDTDRVLSQLMKTVAESMTNR